MITPLRRLLITAAVIAVAPLVADAQEQPTKGTPASRTSGAPVEITIEREVFSYDASGRRDPYLSLMSSSEIRPLLSDLRVTAIAFDPAGRNSVAILRDTYSNTQYRARVGQQLGRMRITGITAKHVQFTLEEYGFNRTETLKVTSDSTARNP